MAAYGNNRNDRIYLPENSIQQIKIRTVIERSNAGSINWQLTVAIPLSVFTHHPIQTLHNKRYRCNFYKCGDGLTRPHYLAWTNIQSPEPDFHLPEFFGFVEFD